MYYEFYYDVRFHFIDKLMFKSCNEVFSDSIEISDSFPQQQIKKKHHTVGNL